MMSTKLVKCVCYRRWYVLESICYRTHWVAPLEVPANSYCGAITWKKNLRGDTGLGKDVVKLLFEFGTYENLVCGCLSWVYQWSLSWRFRFILICAQEDKGRDLCRERDTLLGEKKRHKTEPRTLPRGEEWAGKEEPTNETRKVQSEKEKETPVSGGGGELLKPTERSFQRGEEAISRFIRQGKSGLKVSHCLW